MWTGSYCQTAVRIFWSFDNTLQDLYNNFNGVGSNGPTYNSPGYNGAGACLWLNQTLRQSVSITSPFLNITNASFTFEVWLYPNTLYNGNPYTDNDILGQCQQKAQDQCLHIIIRSQNAYFAFYSDDLKGNQVSEWLNALTIGTTSIQVPNNFFDGCLDSIAYVSRAKNASEVLNDATLVAYLSFDSSTLLDSGPLLINGTGTNYSYTSSGRVNAGVKLSGNSSYIQITGLTRIGTNSWPYTVAVWINPTKITGGTIMHLSSRIDGAQPNAWCLPIMGLTSIGQIAINSWNNTNVPITGPIVQLNSWIHVAATYSSSNGERLYVNGSQYGSSSSAYSFAAGGVPMTVTLGSSLLGVGACNTGTIQMNQYNGLLDEFRVYARELTAAEISALANP
ncbi:unnamed protein product [Rotaria magnacalcarata]|uniref:LamG-like jellyroll fold domain-containing protein n=1 Tax=Rotaria magnacalcarata TaxID=392030 RepID=A0A816NI55_9BILA|nr:unnamed protein product [Rotaria magnacalcarata]